MPDENARLIESGIASVLIRKYLQEELALPEDEAGFFCYGESRITLRELPPRRLGRVELPRTELPIF